MKIAIVTNSFPHCRLELFERLTHDYGHSITVFKYADWWDAEAIGIEVVKWQALGFKLPFTPDDTYIHFDHRVLMAIARRDWDCVLAYGYGSITTWLVATIAKLRGIPFVLWSDARLEYEDQRPLATRWLKSLLHRLTTHFIASGTSTRLYFEQLGIPADSITLAPYALDNEVLTRRCTEWKSVAATTRAELGIADDAVVILYVGRLVKEKGLDELLQAFKASANFKICSVVLVGDGPDRDHFEMLATKMGLANVMFIGKVIQEEVWKYYAISDIFVLPSYKDVWGLVVNEAMICNLPIITTTEVGAWRDLVRQGENGFVIPVQSVNTLSQTLDVLVNDESLRRSMGERSLEIVGDWDMKRAEVAVNRALEQVSK